MRRRVALGAGRAAVRIEQAGGLTRVEPGVPDLDLAGWAASERDRCRELLGAHGAVLFRGFGAPSLARLEALAAALCQQVCPDYEELPRRRETSHAYRATPYPVDLPIRFHNEGAHRSRWPSLQLFTCLRTPESGGRTPLADGRRVLSGLPQELAARLRDQGVRYLRRFEPGVDVGWREYFRVEDRASLEAACREAGAELHWEGERPCVVQPRAAVIRHPVSGEEVLFGQFLLHHPRFLPAALRRSMEGLGGPLRDLRFGDGEEVSDQDAAALDAAYQGARVSFDWQAGDVLVIDNHLVAHGRDPYQGAREVAVAMGDMTGAEGR